MTYPKPDFLDEYTQWLMVQGKANRTIENYLTHLNLIPENVEDYFSNQELPARREKIVSYRSWIKFLTNKKKLMGRSDYMDILDTLKPKRRNNQTIKKWSIPKDQWGDHIRKAPNPVAKMAMWVGFQFGLRRSEISHLRVQDIDFKNNELFIQACKKTKHQEAWKPKSVHSTRSLPLSREQVKTFKRWINEIRAKENLNHPYLFWSPSGKRKGQKILDRTFYWWVRHANIRPHVLRYSFATHYYQASGHDIKLVSDLLGHANVAITSEYLQLGKKETMSKARALFGEG